MARDSVTVRRNGPYAPLSAFYADDDAIATLDMAEDDRTELLFLRALAFCARDPSLEGFVSTIALNSGRILRRRRWGKGQNVITHAEELVKLGLWLPETDGYRIARWSKWNRTHAEIEDARRQDRARKKPSTDTPEVPDGLRTDDADVPDGIRTGSVPHITALQGTALHDTSQQDSSTPSAEVSTQKKPRLRDHLWEALLATCGIDQTQLTPSARGAVNKAVADLRSVNADPDDIPRRASVYRLRFKDAAMTPTALARHWAECDQWTPPVTRGEQRVAGALVLAERYREEGL